MRWFVCLLGSLLVCLAVLASFLRSVRGGVAQPEPRPATLEPASEGEAVPMERQRGQPDADVGVVEAEVAWVPAAPIGTQQPDRGDLHLVNRNPGFTEAWADLKDRPGGRTISQALIGDRVEVVERSGTWGQVRMDELPGIEPWIEIRAISVLAGRAKESWETSERVLVAVAPSLAVANVVLPYGASLRQLGSSSAGSVGIVLPDGRLYQVPASAVVDPDHLDRDVALARALAEARGLRRIRYRNGGNSPEAMDGAGLVFLVHRVAGIALPRLAEDQARCGEEVALESAQSGDVLFFAVFGEEAVQPALIVDSETGLVLEASPSTGVALGFLGDMAHRRLLIVRRMSRGECCDPADPECGATH